MKKIIFLTISLTTIAFCAPALKGNLEFKQSDGSVFHGQLKGDEWFNWVEESRGYPVKFNNKSKNFEYGKLKEVQGELDLVPSGQKVSKLDTLSDKPKIDKKILQDIWKRKREKALLIMYR